VNTVTKVLKVLVVDDVADIRMLLRMALSAEAGLEVVAEAGDGLEAISQAELYQPDLVVLDLSMPVLDGLEALPRILAAVPGTKVVVVSGFAQSRMQSAALEAGAVAYIEKGDILEVAQVLRNVA
jgi:CheY-like chemotaxis protein